VNFLFPKKLSTPHIQLGISVDEGLKVLREFGEVKEEQGKERSYTVDTPEFSFAIYEENGLVKSVWYNDPLGRFWNIGKRRKVKLYLERYGSLEDWEERMDNGWMKYFFNPRSNSAMVYGLHMDVIRFNQWNSA